jgi:hypothetical protein
MEPAVMDNLIALYHSLTLADVLPWVVASVFTATAVLRIMPAPTADSSPAYVSAYGFVHLIANLRAYVGSPQFSPAFIAGKLASIEDAVLAALPPPANKGVAIVVQPPTGSADPAPQGASATVAAMLVLVAGLSLAACAPTGGAPVTATEAPAQISADVSLKLAQVNAVLCAADAQTQPMLVPLAMPVTTGIQPGAVPLVEGGVVLDQAVLHPAIIAACKASGGLPVGAMMGAAPVVAPPAVAVPPGAVPAAPAPAASSN